MRKLDIGVASFKNPEALAKTLASIEANSVTDWRCFIVHNPSDDLEAERAVQNVVNAAMDRNQRFRFHVHHENSGYAGAVNTIFAMTETPYVAYFDNDIEIHTPGWDEQFCALLDAYPEAGQVFPGVGHNGFYNGKYHECLWNAGYAWMARRSAINTTQGLCISDSTGDDVMDTSLGHHDEVDLAIRLRLAGFVIAAVPDVNVAHLATATSSPESAKRIHMGVVKWMAKWNKYFIGDVIKYPNPDPDSGEGYDPRTLRFSDWPPMAMYIERMTLHYFPDWNSSPRQVHVPGVGLMDVIEVLKPAGCYKGRAI